jgi:nucleotide-binding universal stress UspA family protein
LSKEKKVKSVSELIFPKKLMVATDGSKHSLDAAKRAAQIAKTNKSDAIIVHVLQPFKHLKTKPGPMDVGGGFSVDKEQEIKEWGNKAMDATKKMFDDASVKVSTRFLVGNPAKAIVDEAEREKVDLVVVGATGHGGMTEWLLGSVAEKIARNAPCPVLIVR